MPLFLSLACSCSGVFWGEPSFKLGEEVLVKVESSLAEGLSSSSLVGIFAETFSGRKANPSDAPV